jgi:hypothetical protein
MEQLSTIRLIDMTLVGVLDVKPDLAAMEGSKLIPVLEASGHKLSLFLENCTFEATIDSPALD